MPCSRASDALIRIVVPALGLLPERMASRQAGKMAEPGCVGAQAGP